MRSDGVETFEDLLDTAEKLFAKNGIENVPLTRIVARSGQKNRSALHYHFGSRAGVVAAVLDRRIKVINDLRNARLDEAELGGARLEDIVRAAVESLGWVVIDEPWGFRYISILAQVLFHPQLLGEEDVGSTNLSAMRRCEMLIAAMLPDIPEDVIARRFKWMQDTVVITFARWARDTPTPQRTRSAIENEIEQLVAYGTAALAAPVPGHSHETLKARHVGNARR